MYAYKSCLIENKAAAAQFIDALLPLFRRFPGDSLIMDGFAKTQTKSWN
jgi:hypothetical protein